MTFKIRNTIAAAAGACALTAPAGALAQSTPLLPPPFAGAPMNDDPRAGEFSLTFDDSGKLVRVGRAAIGSNPANYPVFALPTVNGDAPPENARAANVPRRPSAEARAGAATASDRHETAATP
jgi:hypothetical protein